MSAAFTPGPWEAWQAPDGTAVVRKRYMREDGSRVTEWPATCSCNTLPNMENARLIAAAPELYELVEQFERVAEYELRKQKRDRPEDDEGARLRQLNLNLIRAALAKARGASCR